MPGISGSIAVNIPPSITEEYGGKVSRPDADTVRIGTRENTNSIVVVNNEEIDVSGNIDCAVGAAPNDLIEGGAPAATTQYYVYLQNTAAGGPRLRLSATAPTNAGYRTGDTNSRLVGTVYLDGAKQVASDQELAGIYQKDVFTEILTSNFSKSSGGAGYYDVFNFGNIVYLQNTILKTQTQLLVTYSTNPGSATTRSVVLVENIHVGGGIFLKRTDQNIPWNDARTLILNYEDFKTITNIDYYKVQNYYVGIATCLIYGKDVNIIRSFLSIIREHIY